MRPIVPKYTSQLSWDTCPFWEHLSHTPWIHPMMPTPKFFIVFRDTKSLSDQFSEVFVYEIT